MKKLFFLIAFSSIFTFVFSQEEETIPYKYLKLSEGEVIWEKIFPADSMKANDLDSMLLNFLPTISGIENVKKLGDAILFDISNIKVDYEKYGGSRGWTAIALNHPMFAKGYAQVKDGKYRIVVKNIYFLVNIPTAGIINQKATIEEAITKKKGTAFSTKEGNIETGTYIESHIEDMFKKKVIKSDW